MKAIYDRKFRFSSSFDPETGFYYRTGILADDGSDTGRDPFMAEFPHILDIGIMGHCLHGTSGRCAAAGVQCYQDGPGTVQENMAFADFKYLADQCEGRVYQTALGGRGDPELHEHFEEILACSRGKGIVPNITTSGFGLTKEKAALIAKYCGAAAVSWYRADYTGRAIAMLLDAGAKTNVHYVLGNETIDEAIERIEGGSFPKGVNRIVFLLHKPVGLGSAENTLRADDPKVKRFFGLFDRPEFAAVAGFDSCCVPAILLMAPGVHTASLDTCEGARFSAYVSPDMLLYPCSFDRQGKWSADLRTHTVEEAWNSMQFEDFRNILRESCPDCGIRESCMGGCPIKKEIVLCEKMPEVRKIENSV